MNHDAAAPPDYAHERRAFRWLLLLALILLGAGIGLRDPWPSDEPRFTLVAKQMVASGDWLFPHRGSELYSDKPPMLMWFEAAAYTVTGNWRIAFLLPSLLAGLLTITLTYDLGRRLWTPRVGLYAAAAVLFTFQFMFQTKRAQIDPLIMAYITLANWGLLQHLLRGPNWRAYWLGCFAAGLGVITKGVGVLALLMLVPYAVARMRGWQGVTRTQGAAGYWLLGVVAFLAAIALWLVPMLLAAQSRAAPEYMAYVNDILFRQTAKRYAQSWSHAQPVWYYLPILVFNWFPMSLAYFGAVPRWWRALREGEARILLPLAWIALLLVFFSIPSGKRDVYLMPAIPMMALAIAPYLDELVRARWLRTSAFAIALIGGAVLVGAGLYAIYEYPSAAQRVVEQRGLAGHGEILWSMLIAMGAAFVLAAAWLQPARGLHALLTGIAALWLCWGFWAYPVLNDSSSGKGIMRRAGELIGPDAELALVGWKEQNLLFADRPARDFGFKVPTDQQFVAGTQWLAAAPERRWVFAKETAIGNCVDRARARFVGHANRREWWVFQHDAVIAGCVPAHIPHPDSASLPEPAADDDGDTDDGG